MKIVIVGAGKVGYTLAQRLSEEDYDVILIEADGERLNQVRSYLEVMTIEGSGTNPELLAELDMTDTDMFIAVTNRDEVNLLGCYVAKQLGATQTIARVRANEYINGNENDVIRSLGMDLIINPEMVTANDILQTIRTPNIMDVEDFANDKVRLIEVKVRDDDEWYDKEIRELELPEKVLIAGILRYGRMIIPSGHDRIQVTDNVFFLGERSAIESMERENSRSKTQLRNVLLIGAGLIGRNLAVLLEKEDYHVKVIEKDYERCEMLSALVDDTIVICGDGTDVDLLRREEIGDNDVIVCLTDDDKINLLVALMARHFGVQKTFVRVGRPEYITLMEQVGIDHVFSPRIIISDEIMRQIRHGDLLSVSSFEDSKAEALELTLSEGNPLVGRPLAQVNIPGPTLVGAIVRGEETIVPNGNTVPQAGDRAVLFTLPENSKAVIDFMEG